MPFSSKQFFRAPLLPLQTADSFLSNEDIHRFYNENAFFRKGVYLASPNFYSLLENSFQNKKIESEKTNTLLKYILRASSICPPFGLFSGFFVSHSSEDDSLIWEQTDIEEYQRIENGTLYKIFSDSKADENEKLYKTNSSLYKLLNEYRYFEYHDTSLNNRIFNKVNLEANEYLDTVLEATKSFNTFSEIQDLLLSKDDTLENEEVAEFINQLTSNQILTTNVELPLSGSLKIHREKTHSRILGVDSEFLNFDLKRILESNEKINKILAKDTKHQTNYIHIDAELKTSSSLLSKKYYEDLRSAVPFFKKYFSPTDSHFKLDAFVKEFSERFEEQFIPINTALDPDAGITYGYGNNNSTPNTIVNNLFSMYNKAETGKNSNTFSLSYIENQILTEIINNPLLEEIDLEKFENINPVNYQKPLPATFFALTQLGTQLINLDFYGGTTAAKLINRYSSVPQIKQIIEEIYHYEDQNSADEIIVELLHLPYLKSHNINSREKTRKYEVEYLGGSSSDNPILMEDILLGVENGNLKLKHTLTGKYIKIINSNADHYQNNLIPIYQFLCDLSGYYNVNSIGFTWSSFFIDNFISLPRLRYKNIILSQKQWNINKTSINQLKSPEQILTFFNEHKIDPIFYLFDSSIGENGFRINISNSLQMSFFLNEIQKKDTLIIKESFFTEQNKSILNDTTGNSYNNEVVFFLKN
ncbi:lantibiotic dehydratase [Chryseobacterium sp. 5_R23647]|uniref:lantibiotic dehydratase n=1 Tax=Chryseobacterium sp. 5_R23647 TaxID=2258964 RepID=UPI000E27091D|nr:lantibiotic dehydratase [Chryseobacterium sp. 5_R23647]REC41449.1 hypothetical protein DRF69_14710 [Chryseobacterium sp. 5_R23647]